MISLLGIIKRSKGEESNEFLDRILENNEISLDYLFEAGDHYSEELMLKYAEEYDKQNSINEGDYIYVNFRYKGSIKWKTTYFLAESIICEKKNGKLIIINGYRG